MSLSDNELRDRIAAGQALAAPLVNASLQVQCASIDLTLGKTFTGFAGDAIGDIDPFDSETFQTETWTETGPFLRLMPRQFVLGTTNEVVTVPPDLLGRVEGRSTIGRLGVIIHATAGLCDPGFTGQITLEIYNLNRRPVRLYIGERICQIVFQTLSSTPRNPYGDARSKYQRQRDAQGPKQDISIKQRFAL
jgi:dCTP deaminase